MKRRIALILVLGVLLVPFACGKGGAKNNSNPAEPAASAPPQQSSDKGIGPIKELSLGPIDNNLAAQGKKLFDEKCVSCHALARDMAGPALGAILKKETPEFVMNMVLNTAEMVAKNETIKKALARFGVAMPAPGLSQDQARAILEYFRTTAK
jgi:mono/diheme cytochrome c family protein